MIFLECSLTSLLLVLSGSSMGIGLCCHLLYPFLPLWECIAMGSPVGLTLSTWIAVILKSFLFGHIAGLPYSLGMIACFIQMYITYYTFKRVKQNIHDYDIKLEINRLKYFIIPFSLMTILSIWVGILHYTHSLLEENGSYHVGGTVYGDLPFHLTIISSILHGSNQYARPIFTGLNAAFFADSPLVYPWIPDYHAAFISGSGSSLHFALSLPGTILTTSFFFLMFSLYYRMTRSRFAATIGVPLTFFAGGIGGFYWLFYDPTWKTLLAEDHILMNALTREIEFYWFSLPAHILFPQRTTQFAYSISLAALILVHKAYSSSLRLFKKPIIYKNPTTSKLENQSGIADIQIIGRDVNNEYESLWLFGCAGLVTGLLPLLQVHSFVAVGLIIVTVAGIHLMNIIWKVSKSRDSKTTKLTLNQLKWWLIFGITSWGIGMPQNMAFFMKILFPIHPESAQSFLRFMLISLDFPPQPNFILLWLQALGLYLPLYFISIFVFYKDPIKLQFQAGFGILFIVSNLVIFQPWVLDNTKVFYIAIFGFSPMIGELLVFLWNFNYSINATKIISRIILVLVFISLIFSGFLCTIRETESFASLYDEADIELANWFVQYTPYDTRVAVPTVGTHNRPVSALGGRTLLASYWGWISNHGMPNYAGRNHMNNQIFNGIDSIAINNLIELDVQYIVLNTYEFYNFNVRFINAISHKVATNGKFHVYKVVEKEKLESIRDCLPDVHQSANKELCEKQGCLWLPTSTPAVPWCRVPPVWDSDNEVGGDCGWYGIDEFDCKRIGCSFHNNFNGPHCQKPFPLNIGDFCKFRKNPDCGGTSEQQCLDLDCIWKPNSLGEPYCKIPNKNRNCEIHSTLSSMFWI